jgi:hypothetical protein
VIPHSLSLPLLSFFLFPLNLHLLFKLIFLSEFVYQGIGITSGAYVGGRLISIFGMSNAFKHLGQIILTVLIIASITRKYLFGTYSVISSDKDHLV